MLLLYSFDVTVQNPTAVFGPTDWGWKRRRTTGCLFSSPSSSQTSGEGLDLRGCDKPRFLSQLHSWPVWQSCRVCWQREQHLGRKLLASVQGREVAAAAAVAPGWMTAFARYSSDGLAHLSLGMWLNKQMVRVCIILILALQTTPIVAILIKHSLLYLHIWKPSLGPDWHK